MLPYSCAGIIPWLSGCLSPPVMDGCPTAEMVVMQTPVANGPRVPTKASVRMAETNGLSACDAGGGPMSAKLTSNKRLPDESTTGVSIVRSASGRSICAAPVEVGAPEQMVERGGICMRNAKPFVMRACSI